MRPTAVVVALCLLVLAVVAPAVATPYGTRVIRDASPVIGRRGRPSVSPSPSPSPRPHGEARFREPRVPTRRKLEERAEDEQEIVISATDASLTLCPEPLSVCPISAATPNTLSAWLRDGYECVDTEEDLTSCGGCSVLDAKYDCTAIDGARSVSCIVGTCRINSCKPGFTLGLDGTSCLRTE